MARSSSPRSRKPFGSGLGNRGWMRFSRMIPEKLQTFWAGSCGKRKRGKRRWRFNLKRWRFERRAGQLRFKSANVQERGMESMTSAKDVLKLIKDNDVKYADFRFTDPRGKWQHVTFDISTIEEETFTEGMMFDGSSIAGWKAIHESDMCLMPDAKSACIDPFYAETTLVLVCDVLEPTTGEPYNRDPRGIARKAEAM